MGSRNLGDLVTGFPERFPRTWALMKSGVSDRIAPGFVVGVWQDPKNLKDPEFEYSVGAFGHRRLIPSEQPMTEETIFDLASVSKVLGTSTLAALLVARGWLNWNVRVKDVFPDYRNQEIRIRHLLSHTAGFEAWLPLWQKIEARFSPRPLYTVPVLARQQAMRQEVFAVDPEVTPGTRTLYSDVSFLLLGFVLEEISNLPLNQAIERWVWKPMGLKQTRYFPVTASAVQARLDEVAATEQDQWRNSVMQGQVHDENCWAMGGYGGHAGAFGTARDILIFTSRLMNGFLPASVLHDCWTRCESPAHCERTLGWDTPTGRNPSSGHLFSASTVGHLGFSGTSLWIDPRARLGVTLLSNRIHPTRDNLTIRAFRPKLHDAVREDLSR